MCIQPEAIPVTFTCKKCNIIIENITQKQRHVCPTCSEMMLRNLAVFAHDKLPPIRDILNLQLKRFGRKFGKKKFALETRNRWNFDGTHSQESVELETYDREHFSGSWYRKRVVLDDGRVVKDVEGYASDPALHSNKAGNRRLHPGSPICSSCKYYALYTCVLHRTDFCEEHVRQHEAAFSSDGFMLLTNDSLSGLPLDLEAKAQYFPSQ